MPQRVAVCPQLRFQVGAQHARAPPRAVIQHDDCGMCGFDATAFRADLLGDTGTEPSWDVPGFTDVDESVRRQLALIEASPWIRHDGDVAGFVYDVDTGRLRLVAEIDR